MMKRSVFLHIGAPKSGTTYLQHVLRKNRAQLADNGVCYPGDGVDHFRAAQDLMQWSFGRPGDSPDDGSWDATVAEVRESSAPVAVISHEILSRAEPEHVERALASLSFADVHIVYTVRDLSRSIPAMWQEKLKNREKVRYSTFLRQLRRQYRLQMEGQERFVWHLRDFDVRGTLQVWGAPLPAARTHVVVTPGAGRPAVLWERFAGLLGLDPSDYDTEVARNASLGQAEAEFLLRLNIALEDAELPWPEYHRLVKHQLAQGILAPESASSRIVLPTGDRGWVEEWSKDQIAFLEASGHNIVGDLAELHPNPGPEPAPLDVEQVVSAGVTATAQLVLRSARRPPGGPVPAPAPAPAPVPSSVRFAIRESVARRVRRHPRLAHSLARARRSVSRLRTR